jgi:maltose/moltooligosaccharide transporter
VVGFVFPFFFTAIGIANEAPKGIVPDSVIWSFYIGAAILILCVIYTTLKVKEWNPEDYAKYNGLSEENAKSSNSGESGSGNWITLLKNAPSTFWKVGLVQFFCWAAFMYMWTYTNGSIASVCFGVDMTDANATMGEAYQKAGNWVGILFAVQAIGSVIWATVLPKIGNRKFAYAFSLVLGGIGFASVPFFSNQYMQFIPFLLIGCAWAAMLAMPFTFVTNALEGYGHMGAYLGLFNGTICIPQIVAALFGGIILSLVGSVQSNMMVVAGVLLVIGALCVGVIKDKK